MDIKAGVRTTEFWLSIAAFAVGVLLASGVLPVEHWAIKLAGAIGVGLASLGYSISRGTTKKGAGDTPPKDDGAVSFGLLRLILGTLSLVFIFACAGWQDTTKKVLESHHIVAKGASQVFEPYSVEKCGVVMAACKAKGDMACATLVACQAERGKVVDVIISIHQAVAMGMLATGLGDEVLSSQWVQRVKDLLKQFYELMKTTGLTAKLGLP